MSIIQFLIIAFAFFALSKTVRQFRAGGLTILWLMVWCVFWLVLMVVTLIPQTTDVFARLLGVGRGVDVVIYLSLVALFYLVFRLFAKIEDTEQEVTKLVRLLALEEKDKEKKNA